MPKGRPLFSRIPESRDTRRPPEKAHPEFSLSGFLALLLVAVLSLALACQTRSEHRPALDPGQFGASPSLAWKDVSDSFTWNAPGAPVLETTAGDLVPIVPVETEADYERANAVQMSACPGPDFHASFVRAFHQKWNGRVVVSYCFREGMPERERFQVYYLPVLEISLPSSPSAPAVCEDSEAETEEPPPSSPLDTLRIRYTRSPATRTWKNQEAQARDRIRFLLIETPTRLYTLNLSDVHPYLLPETRARLAQDPARTGQLFGEEFHWRGVQAAKLDMAVCEAQRISSTPAAWRDALLNDGSRIYPRTSCAELAALLHTTTPNAYQIGYVFSGYDATRGNVGWLLLRQGTDLFFYPLDYSTHLKPDAAVKARLFSDSPEGSAPAPTL